MVLDLSAVEIEEPSDALAGLLNELLAEVFVEVWQIIRMSYAVESPLAVIAPVGLHHSC